MATLEREANAIAHSLLLRGAVPGSVVGVLTGRSANLPAAVLGIWKAGAIYLPLAADLPAGTSGLHGARCRRWPS